MTPRSLEGRFGVSTCQAAGCDRRVSPNCLAVFHKYAEKADTTTCLARPTAKQLAMEMGLSDKTVRKHRETLLACGYLVLAPEPRRKRQVRVVTGDASPALPPEHDRRRAQSPATVQKPEDRLPESAAQNRKLLVPETASKSAESGTPRPVVLGNEVVPGSEAPPRDQVPPRDRPRAGLPPKNLEHAGVRAVRYLERQGMPHGEAVDAWNSRPFDLDPIGDQPYTEDLWDRCFDYVRSCLGNSTAFGWSEVATEPDPHGNPTAARSRVLAGAG